MKKFFKALALVLALTLIVGVVPAQTANAAVKESKSIFVGGAQGKSADEKTVSKISNKVAIYKLAGYKADTKEGHKFSAELAAGETAGIVKITKNYVVAQKLGTVKVDIYVDGEKAGTTTIYSKVNATKDTLTLVDGEGKEVKDGQEFVVGGTYTFKLPRAGKDSDERRLFINDKAVAETAKARVYEYKFAKSEEGDVTIKFEAFQGDKAGKLDGATASKVIKGKVVPPTPEKVKQTASNAFTITFNQDIEAGDYYKDLKDWEVTNGIANDIYYKVGDVKVPFSSVKATARDKTDLTVTMYGNFTPETEYFVYIAGQTLPFTAAGNGAKDVVAIEFTKDTATAETDAPIKYRLLNKAGVDITATAEYAANGGLEFSTDATVCSLDNAGRTIYFGNVGDKATVKATYTFYDPDDNYNAKKTEATAVITAVAGASTEFVSANYSISGWWEGAGVHTVKMGDPAGVDKTTLYLKAKFKTGSTTTEYPLYDSTKNPYGYPLEVKVADEHYAMVTVDDTGATTKVYVEGVNVGRTSLILFYTNAAGKEVVVTALPIETVAARKATSISATVTDYFTGNTCLNTFDFAGAGAEEDQAKINVTVKDQYGDKYSYYGTAEFTRRDGAPTNSGLKNSFTYATNTTHVVDVADLVDAAVSTQEKSMAYTVKAEGLTAVVSFRVKSVENNTGKTLVVASSANTMNTALTTDDQSYNCDDVEMTVNQMDGNYWTGLEAFTLTSDSITTAKDLAATTHANGKYTQNFLGANPTGSAVVATIKYNGSTLKIAANGTLSTVAADGNTKKIDNANNSVMSSLITNAGDTLTFDTYHATNNKLKAGTYTVTFYKLEDLVQNDGKCTWKSLGTKTLTITDSQTLPVAVQDEQSVTFITGTDDAIALQAVKDAYTFKWNGKKLDDSSIVNVEYKKSTDGKLYIYAAHVTVSADLYEYYGTAATYTFVVPIGELLN